MAAHMKTGHVDSLPNKVTNWEHVPNRYQFHFLVFHPVAHKSTVKQERGSVKRNNILYNYTG
jgi:hypothetical protein